MIGSDPTQPARQLSEAADGRLSGALTVRGLPGGTVYLLDGQVTYAESPSSPGVGELLTASGRLAARTWQAAVDAGSGAAEVGRLLVEQGHLTQGELELCVLGASYDAAFFVLRTPHAETRFVPGARHWLGPVVRVDADALDRECRRRALLLDEIHPNADLDTAPVTPVPRPPTDRVSVTATQWELLMHADGQRTPADLAQLLGRAGYATLQELRRLAAQGLLELPRPREVTGENPIIVRLPPGTGPSGPITRPHADPTAGTPHAGSGGAVVPEQPTAPGRESERPRLPRRRPNARLPKGMVAAEAAGAAHPGTDEVLLRRIRTALRALR